MSDRRRPDNGFSHISTRSGPGLTELRPTNQTTVRIGRICATYNDLPLGAPLMVVRRETVIHATGAHRPTAHASDMILAVKPVGSGPARIMKEGVVLPVSSYAEHAPGRNAVFEQTISITDAEIQNQSVEVYCGETAIFGWMFGQSNQKPLVDWLTSEQLLIWTICRLAKKLKYEFATLKTENENVAAAIGDRIKVLSNLVSVRPRTARVIENAKTIVAELALVGLEETAISEGLFAIQRQEIINFMAAVLERKR